MRRTAAWRAFAVLVLATLVLAVASIVVELARPPLQRAPQQANGIQSSPASEPGSESTSWIPAMGAVVTAFGSITTAILGWRTDRRSAAQALLQNERLALENQRMAIEIEKMKQQLSEADDRAAMN